MNILNDYTQQARSQGGGGRTTPHQLPIPKNLFHPLAILFHPLAILFHPLANLCKVCVTGTDRSPPPPLDLECGWRHTGNVQGGCLWMSKRGGFNFSEGRWRHADNVQGGVPVNIQEWGRFSNWWRHADNVQGGGGAPGVPPIQVQTPPHLAGWLRACTNI